MSTNTNSQQHRRIVEDVPQMRSVRIQSAPTTTPLGVPPMMQPFGGRTAAVGSVKSAPSTTKPFASYSSPWKIDSLQQLRPIPSYYRLERTHLKIGDVSCTDIANRIVSCLRDESVSATFHTEEGLVEAETHDGVFFSIRLFRGSEDKTVVELQRQSGCCYLFQQTAKCVLRAAKGMAPPRKSAFASDTIVRAIPVSIPKTTSEEEKESLEQGLELATGLLKKNDRFDAHLLAMESLTHLSKMTKCDCHVAKAILTGPLLETIVSLIESWTICASALQEDKGELEEKHCASMHRLAMSVLANCLSTLEKEGDLGTVLKSTETQLCSPSLLMALVGELRAADQRPHDACEAARCLQPLVRHCPLVKPCLLGECDGLSAAEIALSAGISCHSQLEQECQLLSLQMSSV